MAGERENGGSRTSPEGLEERLRKQAEKVLRERGQEQAIPRLQRDLTPFQEAEAFQFAVPTGQQEPQPSEDAIPEWWERRQRQREQTILEHGLDPYGKHDDVRQWRRQAILEHDLDPFSSAVPQYAQYGPRYDQWEQALLGKKDPRELDVTELHPPEGLSFSKRAERRMMIKRKPGGTFQVPDPMGTGETLTLSSREAEPLSVGMQRRATNIEQLMNRAQETDSLLGKAGATLGALQQGAGGVTQLLAHPLSRATRTIVGDITTDSLLGFMEEAAATGANSIIGALNWMDQKVQNGYGRFTWEMASGQKRLIQLTGQEPYITQQLGQAGVVDDPNYTPTGYHTSGEIGTLAVQVDQRYEDPEMRESVINAINGDLRAVSYSWGKRLNDGSFFPLVEAYLEADEEEKEIILESFRDPIAELAGSFVFDPLNFVGPGGAINFGFEGLQAQRLRRVNKLWTESIGGFDELIDLVPRIEKPLRAIRPASDWRSAARYITGDFRLPASRVKKVSDITSDVVNVAMSSVANKIDNVDEFVDVIRRWNPDEIVFADTFGGRLVGGVIEDFEKYSDFTWDSLKASAKTEAMTAARQAFGEGLPVAERAEKAFGQARLHIADEFRRAAMLKAADEFGDPVWVSNLRKWEIFNKRMFNWAFLSLSPRYYVANAVNNMQMALWTEGPVTAVKSGVEQFANFWGVSDVGAKHQRFWEEDVGFIPQRALAGFGGEEFGRGFEETMKTRVGKEALDPETSRSFRQFAKGIRDSLTEVPDINPKEVPRKFWEAGGKVKKTVLERANKIEQAGSGRVTMDAFRKTHQRMKKVGRGIRDMPSNLKDRILAANPNAYDEVIAHIEDPSWYNHRKLVDNLERYRAESLRAAEAGEGMVKPISHYLSQVWDDDTIAHAQQYEDLWAKLKEFENAESLGDIRKVANEAREMVDEYARLAILDEDARDAQMVGWAVYDVDHWKRNLGSAVHDPLQDSPTASRLIREGNKSTEADVIYAMADETGRDLEDVVKPLTDEELKFFAREEPGDASELEEIFRQRRNEQYGEGMWEKYNDPIWRQYPQRISRDELARRAAAEGIEASGKTNTELREALGLTSMIEQLPPEEARFLLQDSAKVLGRAAETDDSVTKFWRLYHEIMPGKVWANAKKETPEVLRVLNSRGNFNNKQELYEAAFNGLSEWVEDMSARGISVLIDPAEREIADAIRQDLRHMYYYRKDPDLIRKMAKGASRADDTVVRRPRSYFNIADIQQWFRNQVHTGITDIEGQIMRDVGGEHVPIPNELWDDIMGWVDDSVRSDHGGVLTASIMESLARKDFALLNYSDRTYFDLAVGMVSPWGYWGTHNMYNTAIRMIDNPHIFSKYYKYTKAMDRIQQNPDLPQHIKQLYTEKGLKPEWYGPNTPSKLQGYSPFYGIQNFLSATQGVPFIDPRGMLYPLEQMPVFRGVFLPTDLGDPKFRRGKGYMIARGVLGTPPLVEKSIPLLNDFVIPSMRDPNGPWFAPGLADQFEAQLPTNDMVQQDDFLPLTAQIKGGAIALPAIVNRITGGNVDGAKWLEETRLRKVPLLGLNVKTTQEEYWTDQWLAQLMAQKEIGPQEAWEALDSREGPAYDAARRQALHQIGPSKFASTLTGGTVRYQILPDSEAVLRAESEIYNEARRRYNLWKENPEDPDADPLAYYKFYQAFPEYRHRQAAFNSYERLSGVISEEELGRKRFLSRRHGEFVELQNQIFDAEDDLNSIHTPGTPKWVRGKQFLDRRREELEKEYGDDVEAFRDMINENKRKNVAAANMGKYDAMRTWLNMFFSTEDPEERQAMYEALPVSMSEAARLSKEGQPTFSRLDVDRELAKYYDPIDQVHATWMNKGWDMMNFYFDNVNDFAVVSPEWADEYEEFIVRDWPEDKDFLENNPGFAKAYESWKKDKNEFWERTITFTDEDVDRMLELHPQWKGTEKEEQLRAEVRAFPERTLSEFQARSAGNREIAVNQVWRYWTSLGRLGQKEFKKTLSKAGLKQIFTQDFLSENYNNIPDEVFGAIMSLIPASDEFHPTGDQEPSLRSEYDWMGPPIGAGENIPDSEVPSHVIAMGPQAVDQYKDAIAHGLEPDKDYEFAPGTQVQTDTAEQVKLYTDESVIDSARKHAKFQLNLDEDPDKFEQAYQSWDDVFRLDRGPEGAEEFVRRQTNIHLSFRKAMRENPHNWTRLVTGLDHMTPDQREDFFFDFPDARAIWDIVEDTEGPSIKLYRQLVGGEDVETFEEPSPEESREYEDAYTLFQRQIKGAELTDNEQELVDKWFPPESAKSKFWDLYFTIPKDSRKQIIKRNELIQTVVTKSIRQFLDEQTWGVAYTEFLRELGGKPTAGREGAEVSEGEGEPRFRDAFFGDGGSGRGKRSYIGGGGYSQTRIGSQRMWRDFQATAGPLLLGEIVRVFREGVSFSPEASKAIENLKASFAPDMSMQEFIELLRQMYVRFGLSGGRRVRPPKPTGLQSSRSRRLSRGGRFFVRRG